MLNSVNDKKSSERFNDYFMRKMKFSARIIHNGNENENYTITVSYLLFSRIHSINVKLNRKIWWEYVPQSQSNPNEQRNIQRTRERGGIANEFNLESNIKRKTLIEIDI